MADAKCIVEFFEFRPVLLIEQQELTAKIAKAEARVEELEELAMGEYAACVADKLRCYRDQLSLIEADLAVATVSL